MDGTTPGKHRSMRSLPLNLTLLLAACLIGLVLCEFSLRFFYPKYEAAAEAEYDLDEFRIWKRTPNGKGTLEHPDTGLPHPLNYNNLGLRQARDFSEREIESVTSIGFFGDSWTENIRMMTQYSFTEPLDYMIHRERVNVLNFGVDGYGTGQSFLTYQNFLHREYLDHVFYLYCNNDIRNIYETDLFMLDDEGRLLQNIPSPPSLWVTFVSKLHISYLFIDIAQQLSVMISEDLVQQELEQKMAEINKEKYENMTAKIIEQNTIDGNIDTENMKNNVDIFKRIILTWKNEVEKNGGRFYIIVLPVNSQRNIAPFIEDDFKVIDLYDCFSEHDAEFSFTSWRDSPYRFRNDWHWNEAGNRLAAICLYRFLEQEMGLSVLPEDELQEELERYYSAFEQSGQEEEHGQNPIRAKYSVLTPIQEAE